MAIRFLNSQSIDGELTVTGNVGIGTTSPDSELHIASGNPVLTLQDTDSPAPTGTKIEFTDSTDNIHGEIGMTSGTSGALNIKNNYQPIDFYTGTSGTSTLAMQIDDNGFVGIGITNPTTTLHVNGGLRVATVNEATTYGADKFLVSDAENVKYVDAVQLASLIDPYITSGGKFVDGTDTNDAVYTTGNVGIGTTSPDKLLVVSGNGAEIVINDTDTTDNPRLRFRESGATSGSIYTDAGELIFDSSTSEKMRIDTTGNVGIGTTNPGYLLDVQSSFDSVIRVKTIGTGGSNDSEIRMEVAGTTQSNYIRFGDSGNDNAGWIKYQHVTDSMQFRVNAVERMRIDTDGNVGIGTTSPSCTLEVEGPHVSGIGMFLLDGDTHAYMTMDSATGSNSGLFFKENSVNRWLIDYQSSSNFLRFYDYSGAAGVRMVIEDSTGNVGIGTTSPSQPLHVVGNARVTGVLYADTGIYSDGYITADGNIKTYSDLQVDGGAGIEGNTGLGNTSSSPTQKLHVFGNARVTGAYYDSNNSPGTNGQVLSSTATGTDWIDASGGGGLSYGSYYITASGTASTNLFINGTLSTHITPVDISFSSTNGRFTFAKAGKYKLSFGLIVQAASSANVTVTITKNSTTTVHSMYFRIHSSVDPVERSAFMILDLAANDYIDVNCSTAIVTSIGTSVTMVELVT